MPLSRHNHFLQRCWKSFPSISTRHDTTRRDTTQRVCVYVCSHVCAFGHGTRLVPREPTRGSDPKQPGRLGIPPPPPPLLGNSGARSPPQDSTSGNITQQLLLIVGFYFLVRHARPRSERGRDSGGVDEEGRRGGGGEEITPPLPYPLYNRKSVSGTNHLE